MYCDNAEDRADLFQEIVLQLWGSFDSYKGEAKLSTWMYRVALNTAISQFRKQKKKAPLTSLSDKEYQIPDPVEYAYSEELQFLYQAIGNLSEIEKAIMMLYLEDHSYEEISEVMGISKNLVGVKLNRIKNRLRKKLVPHFS